MYDTIDLKLDIEYLNPKGAYTLEEIRDKLGGMWTVKPKPSDNLSGKTYIRYFENYRAELNQYGLFLYGSLCKFLYGNNYRALTLTDTRKALERLAFEINAPLEKAVVRRLHFALSVEVDLPVPLYQASFDFKKKRSISWRKNTLYYERTGKTLVFYDKYKELKKKHLIPENIPENLFRYELRLERPKYIFRGKVILFCDLIKKATYDACLKLWVKNLFEVHPGLKMENKLKDYSDITSLRKQVQLAGYERFGGLSEVLSDIDFRWKVKVISTEKKFEYCKKAVLDDFKTKGKYVGSTSIKDRLVKEVKRKLIQGAFMHNRR